MAFSFGALFVFSIHPEVQSVRVVIM
jgi:hypothetical protein